ncbi:hypothetical protein [Actinomycetospora sp. CA-053990]|uniref:hypothetical protein n=1 Tax=Actinomycetospora sp. CA-053990 TaxID=3239891 RepID=UPI003D9233C4
MTASQEGGQQDAGGPGVWLDMSRYPDTDPDTVLSSDDHSLLTTSLAVDDAELPDSVWEHMLAVVVGDVPEDGEVEATATTEPVEDPADDPAADVVDEHAAHDAGDAGDDPAAHDPAPHDDGGWDGGWA